MIDVPSTYIIFVHILNGMFTNYFIELDLILGGYFVSNDNRNRSRVILKFLPPNNLRHMYIMYTY